MNCFLSKLSHILVCVVIFECFSISTQGNAIAASLTGKLYYSTYQLNLATGVRKDVLGVSKYFGVSTDGTIYATITSPDQKMSIVTAAGRLEREFVVKNPSPASAIKFSPSGQKLVYQEDPYGSNYQLNIVDSSNGKLIVNINLNLKTSAPYSSYDWLDENRLVVARAKDIFVIDLAASQKAGQLRSFKITSKPFISDVFLPAVQPGGKKIAFQMAGHVWMINIDGTQLKQTTTSRSKETAFAFSPDGQFLIVGEAVSSFDSHFNEVWVLPSQAENVWIGSGNPTPAVRVTEILNGKSLNISGNTLTWRK